MPRYQKVLWHHRFPARPVVVYSEIDGGFEVRKVEVYRDGRHDYASRSRSTGTTMLGDKMALSVTEINENPEFSAMIISKKDFTRVWRRARQQHWLPAGLMSHRKKAGDGSR
jgi:hypothetical protein